MCCVDDRGEGPGVEVRGDEEVGVALVEPLRESREERFLRGVLGRGAV